MVQFVGNILLVYHETDKEILVGQFFTIVLGIKAIQQVVVLNSRVLTNGIETAMVVGKHKAIRRYNDARTKTTKIDHSFHDGIICLV